MTDEVEKKRYRHRPGSVLAIPLGRGNFAFARVLTAPVLGFYDFKARKIPPVAEIIEKPIFLKLQVLERDAVKWGGWLVVGHTPLEPELLEYPRFFYWDYADRRLHIMVDGWPGGPVTPRQCKGLERNDIWGFKLAEERLRDHFAGRVNKLAESLSVENTVKWRGGNF